MASHSPEGEGDGEGDGDTDGVSEEEDDDDEDEEEDDDDDEEGENDDGSGISNVILVSVSSNEIISFNSCFGGRESITMGTGSEDFVSALIVFKWLSMICVRASDDGDGERIARDGEGETCSGWKIEGESIIGIGDFSSVISTACCG